MTCTYRATERDCMQAAARAGKLWACKSNLFARTIWNLYRRQIALHAFWTLAEVAVRCSRLLSVCLDACLAKLTAA